jgi:hypothetical protein
MEQDPAGGEEKKEPQVVEPAPPVGAGPRLFGRGAVALASVLGSPVAGGILLGVNAWRLGQRGGAVVGVGVGLLLTYSLLGLVKLVPAGVPPIVVLLPVGAAIMAWVAGVLQGESLKKHRRGGMAVALVVGLVTAGGLYGLVRTFAVRRVPAPAAGVPLVKEPVTENQSVSYAPPVDAAEAKRVGKALEAIGYFDKSGRPKDVAMGVDGEGRRVIVFGVDPAHADDPEVIKAFAVVARQLLAAGEPAPFVIRLAGPDWKTVKEIKVNVTTTRPAASQPAGLGPSGSP